MKRTGFAFLFGFMLMACTSQNAFDADDPFAPGISKRGEHIDPLIVAGRLMDAEEYELAIDAYSRAALDAGYSADIKAGIGSAHLALGRLTTSERLLREAIEQDGTVPEYWNNLGVALMEQGKNAEAEQIFRRAYAIDNGESDAIRDNLRLALAKIENPVYSEPIEQDYKVVRRGSSDFLIRKIH